MMHDDRMATGRSSTVYGTCTCAYAAATSTGATRDAKRDASSGTVEGEENHSHRERWGRVRIIVRGQRIARGDMGGSKRNLYAGLGAISGERAGKCWRATGG